MGRKLGLAIFDLDGTLLRGRTVCEVLAEKLGKSARMREIEALTSQEQIHAARLEMAGWYRSVPRADLVDALSSATLAPGAIEGVRLLHEANIAVAIASITWEFAVASYARLFKADFFLGTTLQPNGSIGHCWPRDKALFARRIRHELGLPKSRVAGVGDSLNDVPMLRSVGLPIFVGRNVPPRLERAVHMPDANIAAVARHITARWSGVKGLGESRVAKP
jgi:phosphoserine phosphatase